MSELELEAFVKCQLAAGKSAMLLIARDTVYKTVEIHFSDILSRVSADDSQHSAALATQSILCFFLLCVFFFVSGGELVIHSIQKS